jgi:peptidoglycan/xylan/chitin deacetylase (PgdA/CDA1 family)
MTERFLNGRMSMPHKTLAPKRRGRTPRVIGVLAVALLAGCGGHADRAHSPARAPARGSAGAAGRHGTTASRRAALPGIAAQDAAIGRIVRLGRPVYCGGRHRRLVALTFDDGPGPYTRLALRELGEARAHATFFIVARSIERFSALPRRERRLAAIGDHTATHPLLPALPLAAATAEIIDGRSAAERATGTPVRLFRPPYGARTVAIDAVVRRARMAEILWDVDSEDSKVSPPQNFRAIAHNVRRRVRAGSIVLMHENRGQTIRALRSILPFLHRRGLRPVTVPELLAADPPSTARLAAGPAGCGRRGVAGTGG